LAAAVVLLAAAACGGGRGQAGAKRVTIRFWTFGREGEVVQALIPDFERAHPGITVRVQQIPFTAAHEKLLTSVVGRSTPDIAQLGNTWLPELVALHALVPLDSLIGRSHAIEHSDYFDGIWQTNVIGGRTWGVPWYVDTRVLFYRSDILADAGFATPPRTWREWRDAMARIRARSGGHRYSVLLPINEWSQPVALGLANGAPLLRDDDTYGDFSDPRFRAAFAFYTGLFRDSLAAPVSNVQIANRYQSFGTGEFAMFISGPWDVGECSRRLPPSLQGRWMTAPMPSPDPSDTTTPGMSLAGGSSLVVFQGSPHADSAWAFIEYLSGPAQQARFYALSGDLPPRASAWQDSALRTNPYVRAFRRQLQFVQATPKIPEWDEITTLLADQSEAAVRGGVRPDSALALLDREVNEALEKRRWLRARERRDTAATS
jgi:multiple sugar transport system substrate-binding protein